jgi:hypothetical protein
MTEMDLKRKSCGYKEEFGPKLHPKNYYQEEYEMVN